MKATKIIGRLIVGCGFACCLTSNSQGQPNLTPEQIAAQRAAEAAQTEALIQAMDQALAQAQATQPARPQLTAAQIAARAAIAATNQQAIFNRDFALWLQPRLADVSKAPRSLDEINAAATAAAMPEAAQKQAEYLQDQSNVDAFLAQYPTNMFPERPRRIDEEGRPVFVRVLDMNQAMDTFASAVWTNVVPSLGLKGDGVTVHIWDGGNVLTNHVELNGRATIVTISSLSESNHATEVAGMIGAHGINSTAIGIAPNVTLLTSVYTNDYAEALSQISTNHLLQSNHSYGRLGTGWVGGIYVSNFYGFTGIYPVWYGNPNISLTEDPNFGNYQYDATNIDAIIYNHPTTVMCWAAGNERGVQGQPAFSPSSLFFVYYQGVYYGISSVLGDWFTPPNVATNHQGYFTLLFNSAAKNSIVVGATTANASGYTATNSVGYTSYGSFGPARDGRIKPDLAGVGGDSGLQIYCASDATTNAYDSDYGTSMAAPNVTGSVALLRQCWNQYNPTNYPALASSIKAMLIHTASQVGPNRGPNFATGWGLVNVSNAVALVRSNFSGFTLTNLPLSHVKEIILQNGVTNSFPITVATNTKLLKVTMTWTDPVGAYNTQTNVVNTNGVLLAAQRALVNDLDLRVIGNGQTNLPWVLDPINYQRPATNGDDSLNNVEVVEVTNPSAGVYTVRVTNKGNLTDGNGNVATQPFSLVISGNVDAPVPPLNISQTMFLTTPTNQSLAVMWPSVPGAVYQVLYQTNLLDSSWNLATDPITAGQTNTAVVLPVNQSETARFFRLARLK